MKYVESDQKIREKLAKLSNTNAEDWHLCLKARQGMAIVYESIHSELGEGEVITTPYTCITSINPILVAGLTPVYHEVDPQNLSIGKPEDKYCNNKTRAIVMQHTVGIIGDKTPLRKYADKHHLLLIEDSAHCVTRFARDKKDHILADISIHSFGVEKVLAGSKFGGAIWINPKLKTTQPKLYQQLTQRFEQLKKPGLGMGFRLRTYRVNNAIIQRLRGNLRKNFRSFEIKAGILEPPIYPYEQDGRQGKPLQTNKYVNQRILFQLSVISQNYARREKNVKLYEEQLKSQVFKHVTNTKEPLLAFPIIFDTEAKADAAYELLSSQKYFIRRWYSPLLYPGPNSPKVYHFNSKKVPIAEDISKRVLCLPTDLSTAQTQTIIKMLSD